MTWTKQPPGSEGWYWWRDTTMADGDDPLEPEPVYIEAGYEDVEPLRGGEWWSEPIDRPPRDG